MLEPELFDLLEHTADAAFAVDAQGEIRFWNHAAEQLFGYSAAAAGGQTCFGLLEGRGALGTHVCTGDCSVQQCAARSMRIPNFDLQVKTASGAQLWVNISTLVYEDARRGRRLVVHLARDISERKRREALLAQVLELSREMSGLAGQAAPVTPLSEQELRILRLFAHAKSSAEIARELGITLPTLRNHLHAINEKLRTHNRLEAVMHALQRGLI